MKYRKGSNSNIVVSAKKEDRASSAGLRWSFRRGREQWVPAPEFSLIKKEKDTFLKEWGGKLGARCSLFL